MKLATVLNVVPELQHAAELNVTFLNVNKGDVLCLHRLRKKEKKT